MKLPLLGEAVVSSLSPPSISASSGLEILPSRTSACRESDSENKHLTLTFGTVGSGGYTGRGRVPNYYPLDRATYHIYATGTELSPVLGQSHVIHTLLREKFRCPHCNKVFELQVLQWHWMNTLKQVQSASNSLRPSRVSVPFLCRQYSMFTTSPIRLNVSWTGTYLRIATSALLLCNYFIFLHPSFCICHFIEFKEGKAIYTCKAW